MLTRRTPMKRTPFARSKTSVSAGARNLRTAPRAPISMPEDCLEGSHAASAAQGGDRLNATAGHQQVDASRRSPANYSTLARTGYVNPKRKEPRRVDRATGRTDTPTIDEMRYMARVRELECCALGMHGHSQCEGRPIVHHAGKHGGGFKSGHYETIALCNTAHVELHGHTGWVKHWSGEQIREFENRHIELTQRRLGYVPAPKGA